MPGKRQEIGEAFRRDVKTEIPSSPASHDHATRSASVNRIVEPMGTAVIDAVPIADDSRARNFRMIWTLIVRSE
jgi:hypothetical protein